MTTKTTELAKETAIDILGADLLRDLEEAGLKVVWDIPEVLLETPPPAQVATTNGNGKRLTASDVARICQVDLKTVHNWCDKGHLKFFRTPGRHLRFVQENVVTFLRQYGYPVPQELA